MTTYAKGDKIRVKMTVDVGLSTNDSTSIYSNPMMYSTTQVKESLSGEGSTRWTHFLFVNSDKVTVPGGTENPETGGTGVVEFDARITGGFRGRPINTTEVTEDRPDGSFGYTHFVFLDSKSVTKLENADGTPLLPEELPEELPKPTSLSARSTLAESYAKGDKIRVTIIGGQLGESMSSRSGYAGMPYLFDSTAMVTASGTHYLYRYGSGITVTGNEVDADFTAIVGDTDGPDNTAQVKDDLGYTHYVYLASPVVSKVETEPTVAVDGSSVVTFSTAGTFEVVPDGLLVNSYMAPGVPDIDRISVSDTEIESSAVLARIAELEDRAKAPSGISLVVRRSPRPGQDRVIGSFAGIADAVAYIDNQDYDKTRVGVEITGAVANDEDHRELERLQALNSAGQALFGSQWITDSVRLYYAEFFSADWARGQASDELNVDRGNLDSWPFSLLDWDYAADARRDLDYCRIEFDGENYYGVNQ